MSAMSNREALESLYSVDAQEIDELPWTQVPACPGVHEKTLWRFGDFVVALIRYQPHATTPGVPHLAAHHHIWVVSGAVTVADRQLRAGSYVHVPPGAGHPIENVGSEACVILQMHRPHPPREAELLVADGKRPSTTR
jgi:mannose-6-phosphate isomerase-like protein (cupin superfamily)